MAKTKSELQVKVERFLKEKHLTKVGLAEALDLPKQNVDRIFNTQKIPQMAIVANFLGISLDELLGDFVNKTQQRQIDGFVEVDGIIYRIHSKQDLMNLLNQLNDEEL